MQRFLFIFLSIILSVSCSKTVKKDINYQLDIKSLSENILEFRGSILDKSGPIPVLTLSGNYYEKGFAYGVLLKNELKNSISELISFSTNIMSYRNWYETAVINLLLSGYLYYFERTTPKRYIDEMKGLADGSGIAYKDIVFISAGAIMLMGCTGTLSKPYYGNGILHGRNFDFYPHILAKYPIIIKYVFSEEEKKEGLIDYWNIGVIGYLPSFNGANVSGISVSLNMDRDNKSRPNGLPIGWKIREILNKAKNLEDVEKIVKSTKNDNINWILIVGSAYESKGLVFDLKDNVQGITQATLEKPQIAFNRAFGDERHIEDGLARKYLDPYMDIYPGNVMRWNTAMQILKTNNLDTPEKVWHFLRNRNHPYKDNIYINHGTLIARAETLYSMVFNLISNQISISVDTSYASLRKVYNFNTISNRFIGIFLDEDPVVNTKNFIEREKVCNYLADQLVSGKLTINDFTNINPEYIDPYTFDFFGNFINYLKGYNDLDDVLKYLYDNYKQTSFSSLIYGKHLFETKKKDLALNILEESFNHTNNLLFDKFQIAGELALNYKKIKNNEKAKYYAKIWLDLFNNNIKNQYEYKSDYFVNYEKKMKTILK